MDNENQDILKELIEEDNSEKNIMEKEIEKYILF
jgi:hypothetical protein